MIQVNLTEAQARLPELLSAAQAGQIVTIKGEQGTAFRISVEPDYPAIAPDWPGYPHPGSAKGLIEIPDDFDEPLEEFKEYME